MLCGDAGRKRLRLRDVKHVNRRDAADRATAVDGVGDDQPEALLPLQDHAASGQPAVNRADRGGVRAGIEDAVLIGLGVGDDGFARRDRCEPVGHWLLLLDEPHVGISPS